MRIVDVCGFYTPLGGNIRARVEQKPVLAHCCGHNLPVLAPDGGYSVGELGPRARMRAALLGLAMAALAFPAYAQMPVPLPADALADTADTAKADFLARNIVAEGPVTGPFSFDLPASLLRARLILVGESHGSAAPHAFDLALLTHLNARTGLRDYLLEADPLQAAHLNTYLDSGDEASLDAVFGYWRDSFAQWGSRDYRDKIVAMRALNQKLRPRARIRFHGIDAIQDWDGLARWLGARGMPLDPAKLAAEKNRTEKAKLALAAMGAAPRGDALAAAIHRALSDQAGGTNREGTIFNSYRRLVRGGALSKRGAYGLWGMFHVYQRGLAGSTLPFAARVRTSDLPAARSIQSIALLSLDSAVQIPAPLPGGTKRLRMTVFNIDGPFVKVRGSATLRAASANKALRVFDISAPGTPFATGHDFVAIRTSIGQDFAPANPSDPTTGFVNYVGVFRGSEWAVPLEPVP